LTAPSDPSTADLARLTYAFDCGDGAGYSEFSSASSRECTAPATEGPIDVAGQVQDDDSGISTYTAEVFVNDLDYDDDTILDTEDNCQLVPNTDQANNDGDTQGDACDPDDDNDTVADGDDNCPFVANLDKRDTDQDGRGNACDDSFTAGRMTGGGHVTSSTYSKVSHGFTLRCDPAAPPQNLQVNWGKGNKFHLEALTSAFCGDNPAITPASPAASFDSYGGTGSGRYNGSPATAEWTFTDAGEPGRNDTMRIEIKDAGGNTVLSVSGSLGGGNHQAHDS
jgi:hypothetical protein